MSCMYADYNADKLVFRLRMNNINGKKPLKLKENPLDQSDKIYLLKAFQDQLLNNIVLRGLKNISKVTLRKLMDTLHKEDGAYVKRDTWVLDTKGTNLMDVLGLDYIDVNRTISDDIQEIRSVLGIEAAREALLKQGYVEGKDFLWNPGEGDEHNEKAWAKRLPVALRFLLPEKDRPRIKED